MVCLGAHEPSDLNHMTETNCGGYRNSQTGSPSSM